MTDDFVSNTDLVTSAPAKPYAAKHRKRTADMTEERIRDEVTTEVMTMVRRDTRSLEPRHQKIQFMVMVQMSALARQCLAHGIVIDI